MTAMQTETLGPDEEGLWTPAQYADFIGGQFTVSAAAQQRYQGTGPKFIRIGRRIRYRRADVLAWIESQEQGAA